LIAQALTINGREYKEPSIDLDLARQTLWAFPGKAIFVAPDPDAESKIGDFVLPGRYTTRQRLPIALCIAAHHETGLEVGANYIVNQRYAKRVKNVAIGSFRVPKEAGQVWLFGSTSPQLGTSHIVGPKNYALCRIEDERDTFIQWPECLFTVAKVETSRKCVGQRYARVKGQVVPRGMVSLRLPKRKETGREGIVIVDRLQSRPDIAIVESASPQCEHAKAGMLVWYQRRALTGLFADGNDFACVPEDAIFAAVNLT
jgi:hypothetical protein